MFSTTMSMKYFGTSVPDELAAKFVNIVKRDHINIAALIREWIEDYVESRT